MPEIPTTEPTQIIAGDTVRWHALLANYPASDGWALEYAFAGSAGQHTVAAQVHGDGYDIHIPADATATWTAGPYSWRARASLGDDSYTARQGLCTVLPAFSAGLDARSFARQALDAVEAYLRNPANLQASSYTIAGRSLARYSLPELWQHRDRLRQEVAREEAIDRAAQGLVPRGRVLVRYGR